MSLMPCCSCLAASMSTLKLRELHGPAMAASNRCEQESHIGALPAPLAVADDMRTVCRRMALAALHFPEARTLDVSERDPFHGTPAEQAPRAAAAGFDPAAVVPAAAAMLRRSWLDVSSIVRGGWLPLLMRCLGCADDALRHAFPATCGCGSMSSILFFMSRRVQVRLSCGGTLGGSRSRSHGACVHGSSSLQICDCRCYCYDACCIQSVVLT